MTETVRWPGLPRRPWYRKINPVWWLGNDEAPDSASFYYKYIRNPAQNFRWYVIGVVDRPHTTHGWPKASRALMSDFRPPQKGWIFCITSGILPYVSYASPHLTFYIGWQPYGGFGIKVNLSNSEYQ